MISYPNNDIHIQNIAFIGLYSVADKYSWRWTDNSAFTYSKWVDGRPDNDVDFRTGNIPNGVLWGYEKNIWIDDVSRHYYGRFICKKLK